MNSTFNLNLRNNKGATIYFKARCFASDKLKYVFGFRRKTHLFFLRKDTAALGADRGHFVSLQKLLTAAECQHHQVAPRSISSWKI